MPSPNQHEDLAQAVLQSVELGAYPESEHVASAELPPEGLSVLLEAVGEARDEVKAEIRSLSRGAAPDIDGWIVQAKQLQADIQRSRVTANEIVRQAQSGEELRAQVDDAESKVALLQGEMAFNESLTATLEHMRTVSSILDTAQEAAVEDQIILALERLAEADKAMRCLDAFEESRFAGILQDRASQFRSALEEIVIECWNAIVKVDPTDHKITIKGETQRSLTIKVETIVEAMSTLGTFDKALDRLLSDFNAIIIKPRLAVSKHRALHSVSIAGDVIQTNGHQEDLSNKTALEDTQKIIDYISTRLPPDVAVALSEKLMPALEGLLISAWLEPSVPSSLEGVEDFQQLLDRVQKITDYVADVEWTGGNKLLEWVDQAPRAWLAKRKEVALSAIRRACAKGVIGRRTAERVETQVISKEDPIIATDQEQNEEWDADWEEERGAEASQNAEISPAKHESDSADADDVADASAWGMEDEDADTEVNPPKETNGGANTTNEDEGDAWDNWGDEQPSKEQAVKQASLTASELGDTTDKHKVNGTFEHKVTLKETYTVTAIPEGIMDLISVVVSDGIALTQPNYSESAIAPAAAGLYSIPSLLLAMYRATTTHYCDTVVAGNMYVYNDCLHLAEQLHTFIGKQREKDAESDLTQSLRPSSRLRLDADIKHLESFGKRAYGKEMESQRTILRDLLDGAQGFANCTVPPFAGECDSAVAITVDRVREVHRQWFDVLSRSALLQSLGSLVSTLAEKIIADVKDMSDIAEEESKKLRGYCNQVSKLSDLFLQDSPDGQEARDMTAVYTPDWFRFQYLSEILDSSLADIKFMWLEGGLQLEFGAEEIVELIEALFAESLRRYALSSLVNSLLDTPRPVPFEFLINGQFLRTSIDDFLTANGISAEAQLDVEYVRALVPPVHVTSFEQDAWVSSVDVLSRSSEAVAWARGGESPMAGQERILAGGYDGLFRVWSMSSDVLATSASAGEGGHTAAIKSVKWLAPSKLVTGSLDRTIRLWNYSESGGETSPTLTPTLELYGHKSGIDSVAVDTPSSRILSASGDNSIGLWSTQKYDAPEAPKNLLPSASAIANKRRKLNKTSSRTVPQRGPLSLLSAHTAPVSSAIFNPNDPTVAYSASWDHTLRTWDLPTSTLVDTRTTSHPLLSLAAMPGVNLLATGTSARHITLIDPRASATTVAAMTLRGHNNAVVDLAVDPRSPCGLVSASHDGTSRIWDIRSVRTRGVGEGGVQGQIGESVYVIEREARAGKEGKRIVAGDGVKVFGVCWDRDVGIVSVGEDKKVQINRGEGLGAGLIEGGR
ncbi:hypothetical protein K402DRAFT_447537 [Aulographum hederae CBS 113979]|uniref:Ribosome biogenesis protein YTM1 n=1 Tax=Aulographum hederae CBS 113979 TaxID=1176131 RepID=A0A6G1GU92_9PEZI|nr:hypothetical protein K402DRAFT_447537 [Aulographum hederae CBS 113979]